jgi:hypothetical protein
MPAGSTYTPIATYTTSGSQTLVTFTSFGGYTDLYFTISNFGSGSGGNTRMRFNSDSGSNYSWTVLTGDGSTASSARGTNDTSTVSSYNGADGVTLINVQSYSNSTTNKTILSRAGKAGTGVDAVVGMWRNTAAITTITFQANTAGTSAFGNGIIFNVYGILAA